MRVRFVLAGLEKRVDEIELVALQRVAGDEQLHVQRLLFDARIFSIASSNFATTGGTP